VCKERAVAELEKISSALFLEEIYRKAGHLKFIELSDKSNINKIKIKTGE
jgi:hypothetical protein